MTTNYNTPDHPPVLRKLIPGYEDPAWDYGDPFGQVKMPPIRLAWNTSRDVHETGEDQGLDS